MLTKLVLLLVYFVLLFLVVRIFELAAWYEAGFLACQLVDPLSLSVRKLKSILDERGISYNGVLEKTELSELVNASGDLTEGEALTVSEEESAAESTSFTCGAHFNEEVEDKKDSVWVVQVIPKGRNAYLPDPSWSLLVKKISRFGVRTGTFDCSTDPRFCDRKGWTRSNLILTLPQGRKPKDNVVMVTYNGVNKLQNVLNWITDLISSRLEAIHEKSELENKWLAKSDSSPLKIILFTNSKDPPLFLSALSVKFTGRFKFGKFSMDDNSLFLQNIGVSRNPTYLVVTPESVFQYGSQEGEFYTYKSMELFLKAYHPEINDIFLSSLVLINLVCFMELFLSNSTVPRRILKLLWELGKCNIIVIILWVPLLWIVQLSFMESVCKYGYRFLRSISATHFAASLRRDWILYGHYSGLLLVSFTVYGIAVNLTKKGCGFSQPTAEENMNVTEWWNQTMQQYYSLLFRTRLRRHSPIDMTLIEDGLDLLVERLAVPDFWLHPVIPTEYIKDLPVWQYRVRKAHSRDKDGSVKRCSCGLVIASEMKSASAYNEGAVQCTLDDSGANCKCIRCLRYSEKHDEKKSSNWKNKRRSSVEKEDENTNITDDVRCKRHGDCSHGGPGGILCGKEDSSCDSDGSESSKGLERSLGQDSSCVKDSSSGITDPLSSHTCHCNTTQHSNDSPHNATSYAYDQPPSGMIECSECAICLDSYEFGYAICGLPCGHNFHQKCIILWLENSNHCCPVCRWPAYKKRCKLLQHRE
ncbi:E3 ubiquitin-protein ligase RNF103-like [Ptychodera flava]|uniref:E3 ubiquitin-protein ligase RNF103-like n=1 Tax=Ptychodera flava TaxID=63121 RepID=UPI00396AA0A1